MKMWAAWLFPIIPFPNSLPGYQFERHLHLATRGYVGGKIPLLSATHAYDASYFVTELLGTDLHRLLTSRPLEKQFIQYFLYQILVRGGSGCTCNMRLIFHSVD